MTCEAFVQVFLLTLAYGLLDRATDETPDREMAAVFCRLVSWRQATGTILILYTIRALLWLMHHPLAL